MQKVISFKKLLNSSILVEYNEELEAYNPFTWSVNWNWWGNLWNNNISYSWMINFSENLNNYFSIFSTYQNNDLILNTVVNKIKDNLKIKSIYFNVTWNNATDDLSIYKWNTFLWIIEPWYTWVVKISDLNHIYALNDEIVYKVEWNTSNSWMVLINQIMFEIE